MRSRIDAAVNRAAVAVVEKLEVRALLHSGDADAFHAKINFEPSGSPVPDGYVADIGQVYGSRGNGYTYGWNADNSANTRDRDSALSPDQRYDTLIHMQRGGTYTWQIAVPADGDYSVHIVSGDSDFTDGTYRIYAEGATVMFGSPSTANHWVDAQATVFVKDGKLSITNGSGAVNDKMCFIEIEQVSANTMLNVTAPDPSASERRRDPGTFRFTRSGMEPIDQDLSVYYQVRGTATASQDYEPLSGVAVIPAGQTSVDVPLYPFEELFDLPGAVVTPEPAESVIVALLPSPEDAYEIGDSKSATVMIMDDDEAASGSLAPYLGHAMRLSATIEAENFDYGPENIAYLDKTSGDAGNVYRYTDADIEPASDPIDPGFAVTHLSVGEWMKYTIDVPVAGTYRFETRVASATSGGMFHLSIDGTNRSGAMTFPATGGWQSWRTVVKTGITLTAGEHMFKITIDSTADAGTDVGSVNYFRIFRDLSGTSKLTWTTKAAAPIAREESEGAVVNGKQYVFGGLLPPSYAATPRVDCFNPATNTWTQKGDMPEMLTHAAVAVDSVTGLVWFVGGYVGNHPGRGTDHVWIYNAATDTWTAGPALPMQRGAGGAGVVGRELHYFGGRDFDRDTDEVDHWMLDLSHPENGWVNRAPLPAARNHLGTAVLNGKIYAIGGQYLEEDSGLNSDSVDMYDPLTDTWTSAANLPLPISHTHQSTVVMNGKIVSLGGEYEHNEIASEVLVYDPTLDMWSLLGYLPAPRRAMVAGTTGGQLIATGGFNGTTQQSTTWTCTPVV